MMDANSIHNSSLEQDQHINIHSSITNDNKDQLTKTSNTNLNILPPTPTRECSVCLEDQTLDQYDGHCTAHCQHTRRNVCNQCVYKSFKFTLENLSKTNVKCPEPGCTSEFSYEEILQVLEIGNDNALFDQYDLGVTLQCLKQIPEFVLCAHPGCNSGQIHDTSMYTSRKVTCIACKRHTCSFHATIWHTGLTCSQYDNRDSTANWIRNNTKQCPKCHQNIEKNDGYAYMTCSQCIHKFCWECLADHADIRRLGLHKHARACSHYRPIQQYRRPINPNYNIPSTRTCTIL